METVDSLDRLKLRRMVIPNANVWPVHDYESPEQTKNIPVDEVCARSPPAEHT